MPVEAICAGCGKTWRVPDATRTYLCKECGGKVAVAEQSPAVAEQVSASAPDTPQPAAPGPVPFGPRSAGSRVRQRVRVDRRRRVAKAGVWLIILSVLFALSGTITGFSAASNAKKAHHALDQMSDDPAEPLTFEDETKTKAEWKQAVDQEVTLLFVVNYVLAAIFLGLFFWSRSSPLPAMITGLSVFLVLQVVSFVIDPATIAQGLLIKALAIVALISGIKAAVGQQASHPQQAPA